MTSVIKRSNKMHNKKHLYTKKNFNLAHLLAVASLSGLILLQSTRAEANSCAANYTRVSLKCGESDDTKWKCKFNLTDENGTESKKVDNENPGYKCLRVGTTVTGLRTNSDMGNTDCGVVPGDKVTIKIRKNG